MNKRAWIFIAAMAALIGGGLLYRHYAQDVDSRGATRLMRAIEENNTSKAIKLISTGDVNVRDKSGQTALFYAARHATDPKVIYRLILAGADPLATDKSGQTPLTTAAKYNSSAPVIMALAKQGRKSSQQQANKDRALRRAAKHNNAEVIKTLLIVHANPVAEKEKSAVIYLAENEKLTPQEKTDYRQVMLVLEILEAREEFAKSMQSTENTSGVLAKVKEVFTKKEQVLLPKDKTDENEANSTPQEADSAPLTPQEKQMSAEK